MTSRVFFRVFVVSVAVIGYWWFVLVWPLFFTSHSLARIHFLSVGQGDAILFETPSGKQVLIDAGRGIQILNALSSVLPAHDTDLDLVVMTHPDADHVGGFIPVLAQYDVSAVIRSFIESDTSLYADLLSAIVAEGVPVHTISQAYTFTLDGVTFSILWPLSVEVRESNAASIALLISYGDTEILLTGDLPSAVEEHLVSVFPEQLSDISILKAGHHGSKTSTSADFLSHTKPNVLVYSFGSDNVYGHPHQEVFDRFSQYAVVHPDQFPEVYETADGSVSFCLTPTTFYNCTSGGVI